VARLSPLRTVLGGVLLAVLAAGCAAPVGVTRLSPRQEYRNLVSNALTAGRLSDETQIVLRRHNLSDVFDDEPPTAILQLRGDLLAGNAGNDEIFALAEMSSLYAQEAQSPAHALASSLYAYAFLFPDDPADRPQAIDPRYRWACDIYAAGLIQGLRDPDGSTLDFASGPYPLPFGTLVIDFDAADLVWGDRVLTKFVPVAEYEVDGMRNRYRHPGIGVALAATTTRSTEDGNDLIAEKIRAPATAVLRLAHPQRQIVEAEVHGTLDVFSDATEVEIQGEAVPLEIDRTAPIASTLVETAFWKQEVTLFLGDALGVRKPSRLGMIEPYRPGRIPVVFVHGTASSPARWADTVNDLLDDERIRDHYQFFFFVYDSGNPIAYSALMLRRALQSAVHELDPEGRDPCLRDMVVIGHSQGGLLTKMTAIDSGDVFWKNVSTLPFDDVRMSEKSRTLLRDGLFVQPLPFVTRVVFVSTPHRGSYLASSDYLRRLLAKMISMPREVTRATADLVGATDPSLRMATLQRMPTSIDNMSPGQPFINALASVPVAPGVHAHSIIPVEGYGPLEDETDGVVAYRSAHLDGVDSEVVIRGSSHSTQANPLTVEEIRRILLLHLEQSGCNGPPVVK
jgi:pimeloyl-ACP methyl ester carboxylesterase